jgi:hypothetical protein
MLDGYSVFVRRRQVSRCQGAQLSEQCLGCVPLLRCLSNVLQSVLRGEGFTMTQQCVDRYWGNSGGGMVKRGTLGSSPDSPRSRSLNLG